MCGFSAVAIAGRRLGMRSQHVSSFASIPSTHFSASSVAGAREERDRVQQVARDQRHAHVQLELALHAADRDRRVVADHLGGHLEHDLGDHRVDLARHDRRALLQLGQRQTRRGRCAGPSPSARGRCAIFVSETATTLSAPDSSTSASRLPCASNGSAGGSASHAGRPRELRAHACGELGMRVQAGAGGGAAERDLRHARQRVARRGRAPRRICAA